MNESQITTTQDIERFLLGSTNVSMSLEGNKQDVYNWIEPTLVRFCQAASKGRLSRQYSKNCAKAATASSASMPKESAASCPAISSKIKSFDVADYRFNAGLSSNDTYTFTRPAP